MPSLPKLEACCCFFPIELGLKLLGFVESIFGLLGTLIYSLALGGVINLSDASYSPTEEPPAENVTESSTAVTPTEAALNEQSPGILAMVIVGSILMASIGILLLLGIYKRNAALLRLSVIVRCIVLGFFVLTFFIMVIGLAMGLETEFTSIIISIVFVSYNTLLVYSYYTDMKGGTATY